MLERFSVNARLVVMLADNEARMLNNAHIGTEHLLLGLIHEKNGVGAKTLEALGVSTEMVRQEVIRIVGKGSSTPSKQIPLGPRAKKVLELSLPQALELGHSHIRTEHILLAIIREGEGVACQVLKRLGIELREARSATIRTLSRLSLERLVESTSVKQIAPPQSYGLIINDDPHRFIEVSAEVVAALKRATSPGEEMTLERLRKVVGVMTLEKLGMKPGEST